MYSCSYVRSVPQCGHSPQSVTEPKFSPSPTLPLPPAFPVSNPSPTSLVRTSPAVPAPPNCASSQQQQPLPLPLHVQLQLDASPRANPSASATGAAPGATNYQSACFSEYPVSTCASAAYHAHLQKQLLLHSHSHTYSYHPSVSTPSLTIGHFPGPLDLPPPTTTAYGHYAEPVPEFDTSTARDSRLQQNFFSNQFNQPPFFELGELGMELQSPTGRPVPFGGLVMPDLKPDMKALSAFGALASQRGAFTPILTSQQQQQDAFSFGLTSAAATSNSSRLSPHQRSVLLSPGMAPEALGVGAFSPYGLPGQFPQLSVSNAALLPAFAQHMLPEAVFGEMGMTSAAAAQLQLGAHQSAPSMSPAAITKPTASSSSGAGGTSGVAQGGASSANKFLCQICGDRASGKHYGVYRYPRLLGAASDATWRIISVAILFWLMSANMMMSQVCHLTLLQLRRLQRLFQADDSQGAGVYLSRREELRDRQTPAQPLSVLPLSKVSRAGHET